jgi:hypothetical protein
MEVGIYFVELLVGTVVCWVFYFLKSGCAVILLLLLFVHQTGKWEGLFGGGSKRVGWWVADFALRATHMLR